MEGHGAVGEERLDLCDEELYGVSATFEMHELYKLGSEEKSRLTSPSARKSRIFNASDSIFRL